MRFCEFIAFLSFLMFSLQLVKYCSLGICFPDRNLGVEFFFFLFWFVFLKPKVDG